MSIEERIYSCVLSELYLEILIVVRLCLLGDPASLVVSLSEQLKGYKCPEEWPLVLKERDEKKEKENRLL